MFSIAENIFGWIYAETGFGEGLGPALRASGSGRVAIGGVGGSEPGHWLEVKCMGMGIVWT